MLKLSRPICLLQVHESTFTAECLAEVLQMPAHKSLLRRHLTTHFNQLLGQAIISHKRDVLAQPYVAQLTPALKIRVSFNKSPYLRCIQYFNNLFTWSKISPNRCYAQSLQLLKKGFSLSRKKTKNEVYVEPDELVCPAGFSKGFRYPQIEQVGKAGNEHTIFHEKYK
jgi:hypothetical protein